MADKQNDLEYLLKQQYYVILTKKDSIFYLHIPELSLIVEGNNLNEAYERLEREKKEYFRKAIKINAQNEIEPPASLQVKIKKNLLNTFGPFFIKLSVVFVACFILLSLAATIAKFASNEIRGIPYVIIGKINSMSEKDMVKEKLLIRETVKKVKPFVEEVKALFKDDYQKNDN